MTEIESRYKYLQLYESLRDKITAGDLAPGDQLPSQRSLMSDSHLSYATVANALAMLERDHLIERRHGKGVFVRANPDQPSAAAVPVIGLFMRTPTENPVGVLKGIYEASREAGVKLEFISADGANTRQSRARSIARGYTPVGGVLLMHRQGYDDVIEILDEDKFPYMVVDTPVRYPGLNQVVLDHAAAACEAVTHLIEHGHTRIAMISGPTSGDHGNDWTDAKVEGYQKALSDAGIAFDPGLVIYSEDYTSVSGALAAMHLVQRTKFTGLFIAAAGNASGAIDALHEQGVSVPQDVAVVSFNVVEYDLLGEPDYSVTGMDVPREQAGRTALTTLAAVLNGTINEEPPFVKELEIKLVRRRSCGCA